MTTEFTLEEQCSYAEQRARQEAAEKHFFDLNKDKPRSGYFSCTQRDTEHWDIYAEQVPGKASAWKHAHPKGQTTEQDGGNERAFCIRGEGREIYVRDERWDPHRPHPRPSLNFRSVQGAMFWIIEELTS